MLDGLGMWGSSGWDRRSKTVDNKTQYQLFLRINELSVLNVSRVCLKMNCT
jgi:hypothetical protein